jgi:hypothetical protein
MTAARTFASNVGFWATAWQAVATAIAAAKSVLNMRSCMIMPLFEYERSMRGLQVWLLRASRTITPNSQVGRFGYPLCGKNASIELSGR